MIQKLNRRSRIKKSTRKKINGTASRPRLCVYRSNTALYVQMIDDTIHHCMFEMSSRALFKNKKNINIENARVLGKSVAERSKDKNITDVVFDRNGFSYHGKIKALAEAMRENGLKF